ncbi:MAG: sugar ABC transporter permease [Chloroflexi bacterium]|nr:sugar ABC transporter permease [Chloroflexota bacterium]
MTASLSRRDQPNPRKSFPTHILVFLAPAVLVYGLFMIYPLFDSLRLGFFAQVTRGVEQFVGFDNYVTLMTDDAILQPRLLNALKNSFLFFAVNMLVQNPIALMLAAVISTKTRGGLLYRILIFSPAILSLAIAGFVWRLVLSPLWGIVYDMLKALGLEAYAQPWLGLESTALITLALISAWQFLGIPMMLYYATLISIPNDLYEAAYVDGATDWLVFWRIKLPLLMPMVGIISLLTYIGNFNAFDVIFALKGADAGPNYATDTMMTFFYRTFFGSGFQKADPHMGAAVAGTMFVILMAGVLIYFFIQRRIKSYEF